MAGKKQHHIPQFLQRGFLADVQAEQTYVHRRDGSSFLTSIRNVAAQRYFYSRLSRDGSKTLDDLITDYEGRLSGLLANMRALPIDGTVNAEVAAEAIAHLTPRSANTRRILGNMAEQVVTATAEAFSEEDTVERMLGLAEPEPNPIWNDLVARLLERDSQLKAMMEALPIPQGLLDRMVFMAVKEHFVGSFDAKTWGITEVFTSLLALLEDMKPDIHKKIFEEGLVVESRKTSLEALEWHIRAAPPEGAILPDCVALGVEEEGCKFLPYIMTGTANVSAVVMPITSEKLLVGVRPGRETPDLTDFNRDAVACSDELFITASQTPIFAKLRAEMGRRWITEIDSIVEGTLKRALPSNPSKKACGESDSERPPLQTLFGELTFIGLGTEEQVRPISEATQRLVADVLPLFNLERLDGITFAADYQGGLDNLERGFDINATPEGQPDYIAQGVATALVLRDGIPKVRIVMHAAYGESLVADEQHNAEVAVHLLVAGLVQACTLNRIENALPSFLLEPLMVSDHDGVLHWAVRKAVRSYRYARDSAKFGAEEVIEQEFSKYLINDFENAYAAIGKAKEEHAISPDFVKLSETAYGEASQMLISMARLLGHRHGMGRLDFSTAASDVLPVLATRQLTSWVEVYARDLRHFWQKETWTRADFYALNIHVERVLWANEIILYPEPNGQGTIIVPAPGQFGSLSSSA